MSAMVGTAAMLVGGGANASAQSPIRVVNVQAPLTDLTATADPLDGASAHFISVVIPGHGTRSVLIVTGVGTAAVGSTFGAHVHKGTCVAGNGSAAGPHYNSGGAPSPDTEVWLDFTVRPGGVGVARSSVEFTIPPGGAGAVVIHAAMTKPDGTAGARLACLPAPF